jgi:hypothetical protein
LYEPKSGLSTEGIFPERSSNCTPENDTFRKSIAALEKLQEEALRSGILEKRCQLMKQLRV